LWAFHGPQDKDRQVSFFELHPSGKYQGIAWTLRTDYGAELKVRLQIASTGGLFKR